MDILTQHLLDKPKPPRQLDPNIDAGLEKIILKALQKDPQKRHRDTRELRAELKDLIEDWTEEGSALHRRFSLRTELSATDFLTSTAESLGRLHGIDERMRSLAYSALGEAVKTAFTSANFKVGRDLVAWIQARMADPSLRTEEREDAERSLRAVRDPAVVHAIVGQLLDAKADRREELVALLAPSGPVAASVLIDLRRTRMTSLELRSQFVTMLRSLGPNALPAIIAALEPLAALSTRHDETLAEDLLRSLPDIRSDQAGEVVVRFLRLDKPSIGIAALRAIGSLWQVRARPLLVGVLDANNDAFRALAIESLVRLGGMDDGGLERLARIIVNQSNPPASEEVRLAAANGFASALPEARPRAIWFLQQRLAPQQGFMSSLLKAIGPREDPRILAALARSLARIDPHGARPYLERLAAAQPEMRAHVDAILAGR